MQRPRWSRLCPAACRDTAAPLSGAMTGAGSRNMRPSAASGSLCGRHTAPPVTQSYRFHTGVLLKIEMSTIPRPIGVLDRCARCCEEKVRLHDTASSPALSWRASRRRLRTPAASCSLLGCTSDAAVLRKSVCRPQLAARLSLQRSRLLLASEEASSGLSAADSGRAAAAMASELRVLATARCGLPLVLALELSARTSSSAASFRAFGATV